MKEPNVVLTTYFTGKPDPQGRSRGRFNYLKRIKTYLKAKRGGADAEKFGVAGIDDFERIQVWYDSLLKVGGKGVIFHDCLSDWFIEKYSRPDIVFERYDLTSERSMNDERYYCYLSYLQRNTHVENAFLLDLFDVEYFRNPFDLIDDSAYDIYCGGDPGEFNDKLNGEKMKATFGKAYYEHEIKLHAGTCGGNRTQLIKLLVRMTETFDDLTDKGIMDNVNMAVYNKCVYDLFSKDRILWGNPLNSRFKAYEASGNFAIRHK